MALEPKTHAETNTTQATHQKAAEHCVAASVAHKEAAKHLDAGDAKSAGFHAAVAHGHTIQAHVHTETALEHTTNAAAIKR